MTQVQTITSFTMEPTGRLTGSFGDYKITLKSGQVLLSGTKLKFEVPVSDMTLPENIQCQKVSTNIANVICTKDEKCLRLPSGATK
jgi:hypothetical protein